MKRYELGEKPTKVLGSYNVFTLGKVATYIENHGAQTEETIKILCGRHRPGQPHTPSRFFRHAVEHGWLVLEKMK